MHIKKHNLTVSEYQIQYGSVYSESAQYSISLKNAITQGKHNYRNRLRREGKLEELERYNCKVGESVSRSIMSNDSERARRSNLLGSLNKREDFRRRSSEAAIKTSARPEIQKQRTANLKRWQDDNPEEFLKVIQKFHSFQSEPEKELYRQILLLDSSFKRNQLLKRTRLFQVFNKSGTKQIDIYSKNKKIIIECDGEFHFRNIKKWNQLESVQNKDKALNSLQSEFCIIRVSVDQFSYRKIGYGFSQVCLDRISEILYNPKPGLYLLGEAYGESNIL